MKIFNKLIRDNIPQIIKSNNQTPKTRILDDIEFRNELINKLYEEIEEYKEDFDFNELADILELIYALARFDQISKLEIEEIRKKKKDKNGGFNKRIFLESVIDNDKTKRVYEDSAIVDTYLKNNLKNKRLNEILERFTKSVTGRRIIDIGCGPGHHSNKFNELGFDVIGIDYSYEMIKKARSSFKENDKLCFIQMDMLKIAESFTENEFDAAWLSASLIHIDEKFIPQFLVNLKKILSVGGIAFFGLKGGKKGYRLIKETKYDKQIERGFYFWEEGQFDELLRQSGFKIISSTKFQPKNEVEDIFYLEFIVENLV